MADENKPEDEQEDDLLEIYVTPAQLKLLKKLDFPCSEEILASATVTDYGLELTGRSYASFESLVGWVAGEANHGRSRAPARTELLDDICDQLESALSRAK